MADLSGKLAWRTFHVHKKGNSLQEYEDAWAGDVEKGRFAIADGASESSFASDWARILVNACIRKPGAWSSWLSAARKRWQLRCQHQNLPWYAEAKFEEGAFATLLGLAFEEVRWQAQAVGDSCLFQVRDNRLCRAFPMRHSQEFGNQPWLLGSRPRRSKQTKVKRLKVHGNWQEGDHFFLMTDALGQWFLQRLEENKQPWLELQGVETEEQFASWLDKLRNNKDLRNDDVTLVCIHCKKF